MKKLLLSFTLSVISLITFGQLEVPVDMYTGKPSITIPLGGVASGDVIVPVNLSYNPDGHKYGNSLGNGWSLQGGGSITREVRGLPDDYTNGTKKGWMYKKTALTSTVASEIGGFVPQTDTTIASTRSSAESTAHTTITGYGYNYDPEPDIFNYSFGGKSGSFVIGNDGVIRTLPYDDIRIVKMTNETDSTILTFSVFTNDGYVYHFFHRAGSSNNATFPQYSTAEIYTPTEFDLYKNTAVGYTTEWALTKIVSPEGPYVDLAYTNKTMEDATNKVFYGIPQVYVSDQSNAAHFKEYHVYSRTVFNNKPWLTSITGSTGAGMTFTYSSTTDKLSSIQVLDTRKGSSPASYVKSFIFEYDKIQFYDNFQPTQTMDVLTTVQEVSGCDKMLPYQLQYIGLNLKEDEEYRAYSKMFHSVMGIDAWGFNNGVTTNKTLYPKVYIYPSEPPAHRYRLSPCTACGTEIIMEGGANRNSTGAGGLGGLLSQIVNPDKGVTSFTFEPNDYLDERTNENMRAGGLRIATVRYFDGTTQTTVSKSFTYRNPVTGKSSGRLLRQPMFTMPLFIWINPVGADLSFADFLVTADKWKFLTIRRDADISPGDRTHGSIVGYKYVTVSRPGAGSVRHEFELPAAYGSHVTTPWKATKVFVARPSNGIDMGVVTSGGAWQFPFPQNPDYEFRRGVPVKKTEFNSAGVKVSEVITKYQTINKSSAPVEVSGLRYERLPGCDKTNRIYLYGKYTLLTETSYVPSKEIFISYDASDATGNTWQKDSVEYFHESSFHKLVSRIKRTSTDGTIYTTRIKYPKDYTTYTSGASDAIALHNLRIYDRHGIPIETVQTIKRADNDTTWVVGASVTKFDSFSSSAPRVRSSWKLKTFPMVNYTTLYNSAVVNSSGYYWFKNDSRYERMDSITAYHTMGAVRSAVSPQTRQHGASALGYSGSLPVVQLINATDGTAAFSNFETTTAFDFSSATYYYGAGHTGDKGYYPGVKLTKTLNRANVERYILGFWVKSSSPTPVTYRLTLKTNGGTLYNTTDVVVPSTGSVYKYYQTFVNLTTTSPATSVASVGSPFQVEFIGQSLPASPAGGPSSGGYLSTLVPVIDDVFFYPENASMLASTYQLPFGINSTTTGLGETAFTQYDNFGRVRLVMDKDRNIVSRTTYQTDENQILAIFNTENLIYKGVSAIYTASEDPCLTGLTYEWRWDHGDSFVSGTRVQAHTYTTAGTHEITLKISNGVTFKTATKVITVELQKIASTSCAKGVQEYNSASNTIVTSYPNCTDITTALPFTFSTIFKVMPTGIEGETCTYQWLMQNEGSLQWVPVGTNSNQYATPKLNPNSRTFNIKCSMTTNTGRTGESLPFSVTVIQE